LASKLLQYTAERGGEADRARADVSTQPALGADRARADVSTQPALGSFRLGLQLNCVLYAIDLRVMEANQ
jgi:hypothetical protein